MRWLLLIAAGCYSPTPPAGAPCGEPPTCPGEQTCLDGFCREPGAQSDGPPVEPDAPPPDTTVIPPCETFASQLDVCDTAPGGALSITGFHTYNTDTHELRDNNGTLIATTSVQVTGLAGPIDVLVVESFTQVTGTLRVTGDLPFGIAAFGDITINGTINANGNGDGGAGHRGLALCPDGVGGNGTAGGDGSSGAGGGGFRGNGGNGGVGDQNGTPVPGASGGDDTPLPPGPLGGCRGGTGGGGPDIGGAPGQGGGAVYLVAKDTIAITGTIDVGGGGGGHGHAPNGAGGGGGSGGMIVIEAPLVAVSGVLAANGGGGGGGADDIVPNDGEDGETGGRDAVRAKGGLGAEGGEGGDGGDGGAGATVDGLTSTEVADNGGGGGGGGCGFIAIGAAALDTTGAVISPARSAWPTPP